MGRVLKAMAFLLAAAVVVDYLLPSSSRYLWLVVVGAVALALGLMVRSDGRLVRNLQTLALTTVLSLGIAIIGVEIAFRVFLLRPAVPDNVRDFERHIAAHWPTPVEPKASPDKLRVVGLADSFGRAGEEGNFYYVAATELASRGIATEVANLSEWGLELRDELDLVQRFGPRYEPEILLHSFFAGNDFDLPDDELSYFGTLPMRYTPGLRPIRPRWFLHRRWLEHCWWACRAQKQAADGVFSDANFLAIERRRLSRWADRDYLDRVWPEVEDYLRRIRQVADETGAVYAMVIHPDQYQVDARLQRRVEEKLQVRVRGEDLDLPQSYLRRYCESERIACLDLLPMLSATPDPESLYLSNDTHYNLAGNARVGAEVASFLEQTLLSDRSETP